MDFDSENVVAIIKYTIYQTNLTMIGITQTYQASSFKQPINISYFKHYYQPSIQSDIEITNQILYYILILTRYPFLLTIKQTTIA